jgi:hypothetical protein
MDITTKNGKVVEVLRQGVQTLTMGDLRALTERFDDEVPVIAYLKTRDTVPSYANADPTWEDYVNLDGASVQGEGEGSPIVVVTLAEVTDNRGW